MPHALESDDAMHQRTFFIADHLRGTRSVTELCTEYGISRKTAYKWIDRFIRRGPAGLDDHSRRPRSSPHATEPAVMEALVCYVIGTRHGAPRSSSLSCSAAIRLEAPGPIRCLCAVEASWPCTYKVGAAQDRSSGQAQFDHHLGEPRVVR